MRANVVETNLPFGALSPRQSTSYLVVHHIGDINRDVSAREIHNWHIGNGWSGIGYHYVIRKDGTIERGRPRDTVGAHCPKCNRTSIGINVVGDFVTNMPTVRQMESLDNLLADLCDIFSLDTDAIVGHRDMDATECPGGNLYSLLPSIREHVAELLLNG